MRFVGKGGNRNGEWMMYHLWQGWTLAFILVRGGRNQSGDSWRSYPLSLGRCSSHEFHSWVKAPLCEINFSASFASGKIKGLFVTPLPRARLVATSAYNQDFRNWNYSYMGTPAGLPNQATIHAVTNFQVTRCSHELRSWEKTWKNHRRPGAAWPYCGPPFIICGWPFMRLPTSKLRDVATSLARGKRTYHLCQTTQ